METDGAKQFDPAHPELWRETEESRRWRAQKKLYPEVIARLEQASGPDRALDVDIAIVLSVVDDLSVRGATDPRCRDGSPVPWFTESHEDVEAYLKRNLPHSSWAVQDGPSLDAQIWDAPDERDPTRALIPIEGTDPVRYRVPNMRFDGGLLRVDEEIPKSVGGVPVVYRRPEPEFWASAWKDEGGEPQMAQPPANAAIALTLAMLRSLEEMFG